MLIVRWLLFLSFAVFLSRRRKHPQQKLNGPDNNADHGNGQRPIWSFEEGPQQQWHPQEEKHRSRERWYWLASVVLTLAVAIGAGLSARYAYQAVEAGQAQARAAQDQLATMRDGQRAWLKLTSVEGVAVQRTPKSTGSGSALFSLKTKYKNVGQTPAQHTVFFPHFSIVGAGKPLAGLCAADKARWADFTRLPLFNETVFPQDEAVGTNEFIEIAVSELEAQAAQVRAMINGGTFHAYISVAGCLIYHFAGSNGAHATGFIGQLLLRGSLERPITLDDIAPNRSVPTDISIAPSSFLAD